jgi:gas vesicle protein
MNGRKSAEVFTAFAIGMGIGAAVGILFAPQSGEETRDYLAKGARDRFDDAVSTGRQYAQRAQGGIDQLKSQAGNVVETGKDYARRAQEGIGQVKEQVAEQVKSQVANSADAVDRTYHQVNDAAAEADRAYHKAKGA